MTPCLAAARLFMVLWELTPTDTSSKAALILSDSSSCDVNAPGESLSPFAVLYIQMWSLQLPSSLWTNNQQALIPPETG